MMAQNIQTLTEMVTLFYVQLWVTYIMCGQSHPVNMNSCNSIKKYHFYIFNVSADKGCFWRWSENGLII